MSATSQPAAPLRLADRLAALRDRYFVGRAAELDCFRSGLQQETGERPVSVLFVYGPGGVGKSVLLRQFGRVALATGATVIRLDGRDLEPSPPGFLRALRKALQLNDAAAPLEALTHQHRPVLLIDTYEGLMPLDTWLRELFLPQLPDQTLVVLAGRNPPSAGWREDPAWSELAQILPLRNLPPSDSRAYLEARGISERDRARVIEFTHGHPLALALVADLLVHGEQEPLSPLQAPDVVRMLLERFVDKIPSATHRRALEVCARTRVTTEAVLADVVGSADAPALFDWLRGLSFIEQGLEGCFPHDLAREVLDSDLRWRDPERFRDLHVQVLRSLIRQIRARTGREQQRAYFDLMYLARHHRFVRSLYDWTAIGTTYAEPAIREDFPAILSMVRQHEGDASADIADYWLERFPDSFVAFRGAASQLEGFTAALTLDENEARACAADPAIALASQFAQRHGALRTGERS
jgi:hypothetical protein